MDNGHQHIYPLQNCGSGQREGESAKAFEAFVVWRDMGDARSYPSVARKLAKSTTLIKRWGSKFKWQERLRNYLQGMDAERLDSQRKAIEEMNSRMRTAHILFQDGGSIIPDGYTRKMGSPNGPAFFGVGQPETP